jgi:hypothetical protein
LFSDIKIQESLKQEKAPLETKTLHPQTVEEVLPLKNNFTKDEISIEISSKSIILKMPKKETDIQFTKNRFRKSAGDRTV